MIINVSTYGISSQYTVDFSRADKAALESFLATKGVYLSDRQVNAFVDSGEGVQFAGHGRKWVAATTVRDITDEYMTDKARQIIRKFSNSVTVNVTSKTLISRAMKVKKIAQAYNLEYML